MAQTTHNSKANSNKRSFSVKKTVYRTLTAAMGVTLSLGSLPGHAAPVTDNLYYTMENQGNTTGNIYEMKATVSSTGAITYLPSNSIAATGSGSTALGITINPNNGQLLVGGGQPGGGFGNDPIYQVNPTTGNVSTATGPGYVNNVVMALGPNNTVWTTGGSFGGTGPLASFPINPFGGSGTALPLTGSDTNISSVAFDPKNNTMYYTSGGLYGNSTGNFGTLNLSTGKTTAILTNQPGLFDLAYDPFSGDLIAVGNDLITQITTSGNIVSQLNLNYLNKIGTNLGWQLANVDPVGNGQLFVTSAGSQSGYMQYVNYANTGLVGSYDSTSSKYLGFGLFGITGSILPVTNGGGGTPSAVPEPSTVVLFLTGLTAIGLFGLTQRRS
ncbi:PEP-CTERM sorting domain-containing protein [Ferrovum sp.]|uniref:PEP-CTERM sorting domain-containing protein n=1 Tax=Ferrovum sp. TaxID=2609467 RepID=UPI0026209869|nr:PEP-CTERM sorting domain-containing protein [Ferrovum sp.]